MKHIDNSRKIFGFVETNKRIYVAKGKKMIMLTQRESQIIALLANNLRPKEIAYELGISKNTVNSHITNIKQKLECNSAFDIGMVLGMFGFYLENMAS